MRVIAPPPKKKKNNGIQSDTRTLYIYTINARTHKTYMYTYVNTQTAKGKKKNYTHSSTEQRMYRKNVAARKS